MKDAFSIDGTDSLYFDQREPDMSAFRMPNRWYRKDSWEYLLIVERYQKLDNKPRFAGEVIPIGTEYGNPEVTTDGYD